MVPADAHGCPACPHPAVGPAIQGSPNVLTNGLPSVRVGDAGIHAACCGPNKWNAKTGSGSVLINGRPAHRLGDMVKHCGGTGRMVQGSPNVIVGDLSASNTRSLAAGVDREKLEDVGFFIHDEERQPLCGIEATIVGPNGEKYPTTTDKEGRILLKGVSPGEYRIEFSENALIFSMGALKPLK